MIDLGEVIDAEANADLTLRRKSGGSYNDAGRWVNEILTDVPARAVVQPATGQKLMDLPEGDRNEARFFLWMREALALDDIVVYAGQSYRTVFVWPRPEGGYTRAAIGLMR